MILRTRLHHCALESDSLSPILVQSIRADSHADTGKKGQQRNYLLSLWAGIFTLRYDQYF